MSNLHTTWEPAPPEAWPTVAYLVYESSLAIFETRHKAVKSQNNDMFDDVATDSAADDVPTGKRAVYVMRLPFTSEMMARRQEREWEAL